MNTTEVDTEDHTKIRHRETYFHIDHKKYHTAKRKLNGIELRGLPVPPISEQYDLWLETHGPGDDRKITDHEEVSMDECDSFYSAPKHINPGAH